MKKISSFLLLLMMLSFHLKAQQRFIINGTFTALRQEKKVILEYYKNNQRKLDSAVTKNGKFEFSGELAGKEPLKATLVLKPVKENQHMPYVEQLLTRDDQDFFLENGTIEIQGDHLMKTAVITGGKTQQELRALQLLKKPETDKMLLLQNEMIPILIATEGLGIDTNQKVQSLSLQMQPLVKGMRDKEEDFIKAQPDSYVTLDLLLQRSSWMRQENFEPLFKQISSRLKNTRAGKEMANQLYLNKKTAPGTKAPDFELPDLHGNLVSLSSFRGKYVLLCFWASENEPSRDQNFNLLAIYEQFKQKNFEILSVSLDLKKALWKTAVKEDRMLWRQLSDLHGWNNKAAREYTVNTIPQNFLIDPEGRIAARNIYGDQLIQTLREVLK